MSIFRQDHLSFDLAISALTYIDRVSTRCTVWSCSPCHPCADEGFDQLAHGTRRTLCKKRENHQRVDVGIQISGNSHRSIDIGQLTSESKYRRRQYATASYPAVEREFAQLRMKHASAGHRKDWSTATQWSDPYMMRSVQRRTLPLMGGTRRHVALSGESMVVHQCCSLRMTALIFR